MCAAFIHMRADYLACEIGYIIGLKIFFFFKALVKLYPKCSEVPPTITAILELTIQINQIQ